jgi:hypothetical protein
VKDEVQLVDCEESFVVEIAFDGVPKMLEDVVGDGTSPEEDKLEVAKEQFRNIHLAQLTLLEQLVVS